MKPSNRHERRAEALSGRLGAKRADTVTLLSLVWSAKSVDSCSRNAAKRALRAEVLRRYGSGQARLLGARLLSAKAISGQT